MLTVMYNHFTVAAPGAAHGCEDFPPNGLVSAPLVRRPHEEGTAAVIITGVKEDDVHVTAEVWGQEPSLPSLDEWQDAAVITIDWPGGAPRLLGDGDYPPAELTFGAILDAGPYRLRVAGRNRDDGEARSAALPIEEYLIQMWPASRAETPQVLKATSSQGALWREAAATIAERKRQAEASGETSLLKGQVRPRSPAGVSCAVPRLGAGTSWLSVAAIHLASAARSALNSVIPMCDEL